MVSCIIAIALTLCFPLAIFLTRHAVFGKLDWFARLRNAHNDVFMAIPPRVDVQCGAIEGAWEPGNVAAFRGIQYGTPPIGKNRFRPVVAAPCWKGTLRAVNNGNTCYQGGNSSQESENCLFLNVFIPKKQISRVAGNTKTKPLPVLFWIHGGANVFGSVSSYGALENIVRRVPHVLVTMNYRLGIFGYLALKELSATDPRGVSGNLGIADQQVALQWVQDNIEAFGGDKDSVTIFGQSSGGTNTLAHLASASSHGLFHRAIVLSGSPNITMDRTAKELQDHNLILQSTRCANLSGYDVVQCLQSLSVTELHALLPPSYALFAPLYDYPNNKVGLKSRESALIFVDGHTVTMPIEEALRVGLNDVPVLFQSTQAELDFYPIPWLTNITDKKLQHFFEQQFLPAYGEEVPQQVHDLYRNFSDAAPEYAAYAVDSDTASTCGLRSLVQEASHGFKSPVYWGIVTGTPSHPVGKKRFPYHTWDVEVATGTFENYYRPNTEDEAFGSMILDGWSLLASTGVLDQTQWRRVQVGSVFGSFVAKNGTHPVYDLKETECAFWRSIGVGKNWWWIN